VLQERRCARTLSLSLSLRGRKTFGWLTLTSATLQYVSTCESAHGEQLAGTGGGAGSRPETIEKSRQRPCVLPHNEHHMHTAGNLEEVRVAGRHAPGGRLQMQRDLHLLPSPGHLQVHPARPSEDRSWDAVFAASRAMSKDSSACSRDGSRATARCARWLASDRPLHAGVLRRSACAVHARWAVAAGVRHTGRRAESQVACICHRQRPRVVRVESRQPPTQDPQYLRCRGSLAITPGR
jgi:hypothetical protein